MYIYVPYKHFNIDEYILLKERESSENEWFKRSNTEYIFHNM